MATLKKLNNGVYEEIPNVNFGGGDSILSKKDTIGIDSAYTAYRMEDYASSQTTEPDVNEQLSFTFDNLVSGDILKWKRKWNGQNGTISVDGTDVSPDVTWSSYVYGTYMISGTPKTVVIKTNADELESALVLHRVSGDDIRPSYYNEFVPTINDNADCTYKSLSSEKIFDMVGGSFKRAKKSLKGKVWIAIGDSYTKGMESQLASLAEKYGMIIDNRGIVSSTVCGSYDTSTGNGTGFQPMWKRVNTMLSDYTNGYEINGTIYTIDDVGLVTFMGGANDGYGLHTWIGSGRGDTDTTHIYGAMHSILNTVLENFTSAKMIVVLQPTNYKLSASTVATYYTDDNDLSENLGIATLDELATFSDAQITTYTMSLKENAIEDMANMYGVHIVDAFHKFPTVFNPNNRIKYWSSDYLHLSIDGYQLVTDMIEMNGILAVFGK